MAGNAKSQNVQFYMGVLQDGEASAREGRPIFRDTPFVRIFTPGDKDTVIDAPVWDDESHPNSHTSRYPEQWARFKAGETEQQTGTPLGLLPGITKSVVEELKSFHVRNIEHLAEMSDANASKFMGIRKLQAEARAYLERAAGAAPEKALRAELEKRDNELEALKRQMAEQAATLDRLMKNATAPAAAPVEQRKR